MEQNEQKSSVNPRENANILSILTFWYTIDLFKKGYSKVLEISDLFKPLVADDSATLGDRLERLVTLLTVFRHGLNLLQYID